MPRSLERRSRLAVLVAKRRWSTSDARLVLEHQEGSGLGIEPFAVAEGLDPQRLRRWRAQLSEGPRPSFVEVTPRVAVAAIEVELRSGRVIRIHDGSSMELLRRVVAALEAEPPAC